MVEEESRRFLLGKLVLASGTRDEHGEFNQFFHAGENAVKAIGI